VRTDSPRPRAALTDPPHVTVLSRGRRQQGHTRHIRGRQREAE
jgi:hypothetical protein